MGTDIHICVEILVADEWLNVEPPHDAAWYGQYRNVAELVDDPDECRAMTARQRQWGQDRNYALFARLAGVRDEGPEPRGLPDDIAHGTRRTADWWGRDGHSHSWCTAQEMLARAEDPGTLHYYDVNDGWKPTPWDQFLRELSSRLPTRCVFWFDN